MSDYSSVIDKIKSTVNLASLIGERVKLQSKSGYTVGLCPFHNEKTPSFVVYPNSYFCFGCKKSGDAISFIQETQGVSFIEAVKYLASKYNIELPEMSYSKKYIEQKDLAKRLFLAVQSAQVFFINKLFSSEGVQAREYLHSRSFTDQDIRLLGFGYAPHGSNCFNKLKQEHFSNKEIIEASLANEKNGNYYDFFQDRITIPIYDSYSRLVAFSGRAISKEVLPKYKNSRENALFLKSNILFGFYKAKDKVRQGAKAILVEGNLDVFRLWLSGFGGAVASMGTAINEGHLKQIAYFTKELYLILDGDFAGKKATMSTIDLALNVPDLKIKVCVLPSGEDPDSFILKNGSESFENLMNNNSIDLVDYVISQVLDSADSLQIPYKVSTSIVPWLSRLQDPIQRSFLISRVSEITGIDSKEIGKQVKSKILEKIEKDNSESFSSFRKNSNNDKIRKNNKEDLLNKDLDSSIYDVPLSSLDKELLSHLILYDGSNSKKVIEDLQTYLKYIKLDDIWLSFIKEIIQSLSVGKLPWKEELYTGWATFIYDKVIRFTQELKENEKAFDVKNREESILKILKQYKKLYLQDAISSLKQQLSAETDNLEILKSISSMNNELKFL